MVVVVVGIVVSGASVSVSVELFPASDSSEADVESSESDDVSLSVCLLRLDKAASSSRELVRSPRASNRIAMTLVPANPSANRSSLPEKPVLH